MAYNSTWHVVDISKIRNAVSEWVCCSSWQNAIYLSYISKEREPKQLLSKQME
jgi:hypothetical protein